MSLEEKFVIVRNAGKNLDRLFYKDEYEKTFHS